MPVPPTPTCPGECTWTRCTPPVPGAVSIIQLTGDIDTAFDRLHIPRVAIGRVALRSLSGLDMGLVARWLPTSAQLMPHGGVAVMRALFAALSAAGLPEAAILDPRLQYPEATSDVEAHMLAALARAASPLAINRLLTEPARWVDHQHGTRDFCPPHIARQLQRLIDPPLVVAIGRANVGKSTLVNALAGRHVAIVADEPGTTRDHVGVLLDLAGLVVRYVDTPGLRPDPDRIEREAQALALTLARDADLVLLVGDASSPPLDPSPVQVPSDRTLRVALRHDLGAAACAVDVRVSAANGQGLSNLTATIRDRLVSASALEHPGAWPFWSG